MRGIDLRGVFGVWECLILCQRELGGVFRVWVGLILCQRRLEGFGLPFKNKFLFGLKKVEGLWVRNLASRRDKFMFGLIKINGLWV